MTDLRDPDSGATLRLKNLRCRRTGQWLTPEQHLQCPYCLGDEERLARGQYAGFCDYDAKKDPISFGFPPDGTHMLKG
jgi:hypothetical protein